METYEPPPKNGTSLQQIAFVSAGFALHFHHVPEADRWCLIWKRWRPHSPTAMKYFVLEWLPNFNETN